MKYTLGSESGNATPGTDFSKTFDNAINASTLTVETTAKRAYISKIVLKTGSSTVYTSIAANIDPNYKIYVGDTLDKTKLTVSISDGKTSKPITNYSVTNFDSSKAGKNTITITYDAQTPTLSTTLELTINENALVSISVTTSSPTRYVGETFKKSSLTVTANYEKGNSTIVTDFTCSLEEDHMFLYEESNGSISVTVSYQGKIDSISLTISRNEYVQPEGSSKKIESSSFSTLGGSSSSKVNKTIKNNSLGYDVDFYFYNSYYYSSAKAVSFGSTSSDGGYIQNTTPFKNPLTAVSFVDASGVCSIKISRDGNTWVNYSTTTLKNDNYYYFRIYYKVESSNASASTYSYIDPKATYINITSMTFSFAGIDTASTLTDYIMKEDTLNQCLSKFDIARSKYLQMSSEEQATFQTSNEYKIATARTRYEAWAKSLGKNPYQEGNVNSLSSIGNILASDHSSIVVICVGIASIASLSIFIKIKRRKSNF